MTSLDRARGGDQAALNELFERYYERVRVIVVAGKGEHFSSGGNIKGFLDRYTNPTKIAPEADKLAMNSPSPLPADADGKYPVPQPGKVVDREY